MLSRSSSKVHYPTESQTTFALALKDLGFGSLLQACGFRKFRGVPPMMVILGMLMQIFGFDSINHRMTSERGKASANHCDNVAYDFMNCPCFNWLRLCTKLAAAIIGKLDQLNAEHRDSRCFIIDDTITERRRGKSVELLCRVYDHVFNRTVKGFTTLMLSWTDGISSIPVNYSVVSSSDDKQLITGADGRIDQRTVGAKRRRQARMSKPSLVIELLKEALLRGIRARYVLMDTWFTNEPLIQSIMGLGLGVIGMVKQTKQTYFCGDKDPVSRKLTTLYRWYIRREARKNGKRKGKKPGIHGSIIVRTRNHLIPLKIVFLRSRGRKSRIIFIASTNLNLTDEEIVSIYSRRFSIEHNFFAMKHYLNFGKETRCRCFDSTVGFTALSVIRVMVLEWIRRGTEEVKTAGALFHEFEEEMHELPFKSALNAVFDAINNTLPKLMAAAGAAQEFIDKVMTSFKDHLNGIAQIAYVKRFLKDSLSPDEFKRRQAAADEAALELESII